MSRFEMTYFKVLTEAFDGGFDYKPKFVETRKKDPATGKRILDQYQEIKFFTDNNDEYRVLFTKINPKDASSSKWFVDFFSYSVNKNRNEDEDYNPKRPKKKSIKSPFVVGNLDVSINGNGSQMRVFATVIDIINDFADFAGDRVTELYFHAVEPNRRSLYKRLVSRYTDKFKLASYDEDSGEFILKRVN